MEPEADAVRLEGITVPTFDGTCSAWISFGNLFKSFVYHKGGQSEVQKLQYFRTSAREEAYQPIRHLNMLDAYYYAAWDLLMKR